MKRPSPRLSSFVAFGLALAAWSARSIPLQSQVQPKVGEWPTYGATLASTRYSPLDQIKADNFNRLEVAWRFKTDAMGPRPEFNLQATPLVVNGRMYSTAGTEAALIESLPPSQPCGKTRSLACAAQGVEIDP